MYRLLVNLQHLSAGENNLLEIPAEIGEFYDLNNVLHDIACHWSELLYQVFQDK